MPRAHFQPVPFTAAPSRHLARPQGLGGALDRRAIRRVRKFPSIERKGATESDQTAISGHQGAPRNPAELCSGAAEIRSLRAALATWHPSWGRVIAGGNPTRLINHGESIAGAELFEGTSCQPSALLTAGFREESFEIDGPTESWLHRDLLVLCVLFTRVTDRACDAGLAR